MIAHFENRKLRIQRGLQGPVPEEDQPPGLRFPALRSFNELSITCISLQQAAEILFLNKPCRSQKIPCRQSILPSASGHPGSVLRNLHFGLLRSVFKMVVVHGIVTQKNSVARHAEFYQVIR